MINDVNNNREILFRYELTEIYENRIIPYLRTNPKFQFLCLISGQLFQQQKIWENFQFST